MYENWNACHAFQRRKRIFLPCRKILQKKKGWWAHNSYQTNQIHIGNWFNAETVLKVSIKKARQTLSHGDTLLPPYYISYMTTISNQSAMTVDKFQGELSKRLAQCTRLFDWMSHYWIGSDMFTRQPKAPSTNPVCRKKQASREHYTVQATRPRGCVVG